MPSHFQRRRHPPARTQLPQQRFRSPYGRHHENRPEQTHLSFASFQSRNVCAAIRIARQTDSKAPDRDQSQRKRRSGLTESAEFSVTTTPSEHDHADRQRTMGQQRRPPISITSSTAPKTHRLHGTGRSKHPEHQQDQNTGKPVRPRQPLRRSPQRGHQSQVKQKVHNEFPFKAKIAGFRFGKHRAAANNLPGNRLSHPASKTRSGSRPSPLSRHLGGK